MNTRVIPKRIGFVVSAVMRFYGELTDRPSKLHWDLINPTPCVKSHCSWGGLVPIGLGGPLNLSGGRFDGNAVLGGALTDRPRKLHWNLEKEMSFARYRCNLGGFIPIGLGGL